MKLFKKISYLFIIIVGALLLSACASHKEDKERLVRYLNNVYGENAYEMKEDPRHSCYWFVTLKDYPNISFTCSVSHDWLAIGSPFIHSDFEETFCTRALAEYKENHNLGDDVLSYLHPVNFVYSTEVTNLDQLKEYYDKMLDFINYTSLKYPILAETDCFGVRMDISGIRLKSSRRDLDGSIDTSIYRQVCYAENGKLNIRPFEEIRQELEPQLRTHPENSKGFVFIVNTTSFVLGSDTLDDCLYKHFELSSTTVEELQKIKLQPGESSESYILAKDYNENSLEYYTKVTVQVKNLSDKECSVLDGTLVKAVISDPASMYIGDVYFEFDKRKELTADLYDMLGIKRPSTSEEESDGVPYKNIRVLFKMKSYFKEIDSVTLSYQE
jgi:hypothetical protein